MTSEPGGPVDPVTNPPPAVWQPAPATVPAQPAAPEAAIAATPVEPVTVVRPRNGRSGLRWGIALLIVALVVATASATFIVLAGAAASSTVARWAPADTAIYAEARFDLPGDQQAKLAEFLSAFPGFADQSTLDTKLDELYDKIARSAGKGIDYSTQIEPWFGGQLALAAPTPASLSKTAPRTSPHAALIANVKDQAKATAWLAGLSKGSGSSATYGGVSLTVGSKGGLQYAYGVDGPILVAGDLDTVHAVIDTKGDSGLASTDGYRQALAAYQGDHLAFVYADTARLMSSLTGSLGGAKGCGLAAATGLTWSAMAVSAEGDHLLADAAAPLPAGAKAGTDRVSVLAPKLPGSSIVVVETHDLGAGIDATVARFKADPACADAVKSVTDALDRFGGLASFTSWLGDTAIVVTHDGTTIGGGLVVALPDAKAADMAAGKLASVKNLATLSGAAKVSQADHNGATITTIAIGDLSSLLPSAGLSPGDLKALDASISYTIHDGLLIVGVGGDGFVKAVLDTKSGASLADQSRYKTALDRAGASNTASAYVDVHAVIGAVESAMPADARASFDKEYKPYLDPLQAIAVSKQAGNVAHSRFVLTVAK